MKINKEGYGIIRYSAIATFGLLAVLWMLVARSGTPVWVATIVSSLLLIPLLFVLLFFRQPRREVIYDPSLAFAPADGKVVVVEQVYVGEYLEEKRIQVSVFMSLTNVHSNSYPVGGRVAYFRYHPGKFLVAWHPKSSEDNERTTTVVDTGRHKILFRQIAGKVARRIVSYPVVGEEAQQNHKMGFIKFGSRVDVMLPLDSQIMVNIGDKVRGGQTPIAKLS